MFVPGSTSSLGNIIKQIAYKHTGLVQINSVEDQKSDVIIIIIIGGGGVVYCC